MVILFYAMARLMQSLRFHFQDKDAYLNEENSNKTIYINKPSLFGGDEQSGGVQGNIELLFGHAEISKKAVFYSVFAQKFPMHLVD